MNSSRVRKKKKKKRRRRRRRRTRISIRQDARSQLLLEASLERFERAIEFNDSLSLFVFENMQRRRILELFFFFFFPSLRVNVMLWLLYICNRRCASVGHRIPLKRPKGTTTTGNFLLRVLFRQQSRAQHTRARCALLLPCIRTLMKINHSVNPLTKCESRPLTSSKRAGGIRLSSSSSSS